MKAKQFAKQFMEGADCFPDFNVVVRHGKVGKEEPINVIKVGGGKIIFETANAYPKEDAYLSACRANHWRTAQLRANGIEPVTIPADAPHDPPKDYDFKPARSSAAAVLVDGEAIADATLILSRALGLALPATAKALADSASLDALETAAVRAVAALLARAEAFA